MPRNYDTTNHKPYPRVTLIEIKYDRAGVPTAEYVEQMAVVDGNGEIQHIDGTERRHALNLSLITEPVQVPDPATGKPIPGKFTTREEMMLGLFAFLRADQINKDTTA